MTSSAGTTTPPDQLLLNATPIAAVDVRWPMIAFNGADTHLLEPIAQLVYRGSDVTEVGVTNDNAHSFVLDDSNIFSYNRFTGTDRQETGLRANVGARYLANFDGGSWLELVGGQSFHLAGLNAMGVGDEVNTGVSTGLGEDASYVVLAARGSPGYGTVLSASLQLDPAETRVARAVRRRPGLPGRRILGRARLHPYPRRPGDRGDRQPAGDHPQRRRPAADRLLDDQWRGLVGPRNRSVVAGDRPADL